jgi:cytochrome bd-type quinol oxidase subunit 2
VTGEVPCYSLGNRRFVWTLLLLSILGEREREREREKNFKHSKPWPLWRVLWLLLSLLSLLYHVWKTLFLMSNRSFGLLRKHLSNRPWNIYVSVQLFEGIILCFLCLSWVRGSDQHFFLSSLICCVIIYSTVRWIIKQSDYLTSATNSS